MKTTDFKFDKKAVSYEVLEDGYAIYLDGEKWVEQRGQYGKPIDNSKSYEENCLAQIEELCTTVESSNSTDEVTTLKAQVEYLAMMSDVDLSVVSTDTTTE